MFSFSDTFDRIEKFQATDNSWLESLMPISYMQFTLDKLARKEYQNILSCSEEYLEYLKYSFGLSDSFVFKYFYCSNFVCLSEMAIFRGEFDNEEYSACYPTLAQLHLTDEKGFLEYPFMLEDLVNEICRRFYNSNLEQYAEGAFAGKQINFAEALDFWLNLNAPAGFIRAISYHLTSYYISDIVDVEDNMDMPLRDQCTDKWGKRICQLLALNKDEWNTRLKCMCTACCMDIRIMHWLLNHLLKNVADLQLPEPYVPGKITPPYDLDKLLNNLSPVCKLHLGDLKSCTEALDSKLFKDEDYVQKQQALTGYHKEGIIRLAMQYQLQRLKDTSPDDNCSEAKKFSVLLNTIFSIDRELIKENSNGWLSPYFNWLDEMYCRARLDGAGDSQYIIPDYLIIDLERISQANELIFQRISEISIPAKQKISNDTDICATIAYLSELSQQLDDVSYEFFGRQYGWRSELKDLQFDLHRSILFWLKEWPRRTRDAADLGTYLSVYPKWKFNTPEVKEFVDKIIADIWNVLTVEVKDILTDKVLVPGDKILFFNLLKDLPGYENSSAKKMIDSFCQEKVSSPFKSWGKQWKSIKSYAVSQKQQRELQLVEAESAARKKVLFEISHSIKNLVASVSEPLEMLQDELSGAQRRTVENALAGAGLIRDLAVGVHMSMRGDIGAWRQDVKEPGFGAATLDKIILEAMRHAVSNMFDGKYFSLFVRNYFGRDLETFMQAQNEWKAAETAEQTFECINKYFFDLKIDCHDTDLKVAVGDRDGTATKLLILFQELFLNAVKYSSFVEREKRFVKLDITIAADKWNISVSNSAVERKTVKSSGIGLSVIKNFATLFEAAYNAAFAADVYKATMKFFLNK